MKVFVVGLSKLILDMFSDKGYEIAQSVDSCDIIVFTGGADVDPDLYGHEKHFTTHICAERDKAEVEIYNLGKRLGKKMIGICRGAQFLHVMNGGKLVQDCDGHAIGGRHSMHCVATGMTYMVTSTHHQQMDHGVGEVIGYANITSRQVRWLEDGKKFNHTLAKCAYRDLEVVWHADTNCLCYQPHPEYDIGGDTHKHFFELLTIFFKGE